MDNYIIKAGNTFMLKYHNDMNVVKFKDFGQRELNIFFSICSVMANKKLSTITLSFEDVKKITNTTFADNKELVEYMKTTYEKFQKLNGSFQKGGVYTSFVLFPTFKIDENEQLLTIKINKEFAYILNEITKNFTIFELREFNSLKSIYSKHLFRLLKQWKSTGCFKIETEEFKRLLDVPESYQMMKITQKILNPVIQELSKYFTGLTLTKIKEGRQIKFLEFTFQVQKNGTTKIASDEILCPSCNKPLQLIKTKEGEEFFGHKNFKTSDCQMTYSNIDEVNAVKRRQEQYQKMLAEAEAELEEEADSEEDIENTEFYQEHLKKKARKTK